MTPLEHHQPNPNIGLSGSVQGLGLYPAYKRSCFVDAGRRPKIPESQTKDFIAHSKSSIQSFMLICVGSPCPTSPTKVTQRVHDGCLGMQWVVLEERIMELGRFSV